MGAARVTVQNLQVVKTDSERGLLKEAEASTDEGDASQTPEGGDEK